MNGWPSHQLPLIVLLWSFWMFSVWTGGFRFSSKSVSLSVLRFEGQVWCNRVAEMSELGAGRRAGTVRGLMQWLWGIQPVLLSWPCRLTASQLRPPRVSASLAEADAVSVTPKTPLQTPPQPRKDRLLSFFSELQGDWEQRERLEM